MLQSVKRQAILPARRRFVPKRTAGNSSLAGEANVGSNRWRSFARSRSRSGGRTSRLLASAGAALALGVGTLVVVGAGGTAGAANFAPRGPVATPVALHSGYLADLSHVRTGKPSGVVPPLRKGAGTAAQPPQTSTPIFTPTRTTPFLGPMTWHGGPVQHSPHLYLLLWGSNWTTTTKQKASAGYLESFLRGLGTEKGPTPDHWSTITSQYNDSTGYPSFKKSVYVQAYITTSQPPTGVTRTKLGAEAEAFAEAHTLSTLTTDQVIVATQSGTCPADFAGCGKSGTYCAWHSVVSTPSGTVPYTNLPYLPDANKTGATCGAGFRTSSTPANEGFSIVEGHEYAETVTDPQVGTGWLDRTQLFHNPYEIGDKCVWNDKTTAESFDTGSFVVQPLYSNAAWSTTGSGCVLSATGGGTGGAKSNGTIQTTKTGHGGIHLTGVR